jgi:hypothetical protein
LKKTLLVIVLSLFAFASRAQKVDSIFFNLYTDSLKKGALHFNYINVDGKLADGRYIPLDTTQVRFCATAGKFTGNVLTLDSTLKAEYVVISASLISNPAIKREVKIYIKRTSDEEPLKTADELIEGWQKGKKKN